MFKITQLLLILYLSSRGKKSTLIRIHLFNWALKDEKRKKLLYESAKKESVLFGVWGIDPAVNISLRLAIAEGLINMDGVAYKLSLKGQKFISSVDEKFALESDYLFLKKIGIKISEGMVQEIVGAWR